MSFACALVQVQLVHVTMPQLSNRRTQNGRFVLRSASCLDAFSSYLRWRSYLAMPGRQPIHQRPPQDVPLVLVLRCLQSSQALIDRNQPVSQRSEPSSRSLLTGEQPYSWQLVHHQARKSRHRGSKPRGQYIQRYLTLHITCCHYRKT